MSPRSLKVPGCRPAGSDGSGPVSTASVVRAEAAAVLTVVALLGAGVRSTPAIVGGAIGAVALTIVSLAGRPVTGWAGLALRYAARPRTRVVLAERPPGHRRRRMRQTAPTDTLTALLPGAVLVEAHDRDGRGFAVLARHDFRTVVVAVDPPEDPIVDLSRPLRVPLPELAAVLELPELSLHSVQMVSESWPMRPLAAVGQLATTVARRRTFVAVQAGVEGNVAITLRGGGTLGATRLMAAAAKRVELVLAAAGVESHPLVATEWRGALAASSGLDREPRTLREQWSDVTTPVGRHRTFDVEVAGAAGGAVDALVASAADVITTSVVLNGGPPQCTVRVSAPGRHDLDVATEQLTAAAGRAGLGLRSRPGAQLAGLCETLPIGAVEC
jgi:type VII secretion protein EccE